MRTRRLAGMGIASAMKTFANPWDSGDESSPREGERPQPDVMRAPLGDAADFVLCFGMVIRALKLCVLILAVFGLAPEAFAGQPGNGHPVVIELFTSQGCSDCPAADRIVVELAKRQDVIALSLPITYWDMLGWKDTFATGSNTKRQQAYAKAMKRSGIYTPQVVVDGVVDVVGNQRARVLSAIAARGAHLANQPPVDLSVGLASGRVEISIGAISSKEKPLATIWVMRTLSLATVNVQQGENKNRALTYANLVRDMQRAGEWTGEAMKINLPVALGPSKHDGVAVILQNNDYGEVLAAAIIPVPAGNLVAVPH